MVALYSFLFISGCATTTTNGGKIFYQYEIGKYCKNRVHDPIVVCGPAFRLIYGLSKAELERLQKAVKSQVSLNLRVHIVFVKYLYY